MSTRKLATLLVLAALTATQVGCLFGASSKVTQTGNVVSPTTFEQIEVGKSTGAFVKGILGKPDNEAQLDDGSELWRWNYAERKEDSGYVFLIFGGTNEKVVKKAAYVQVRDGIVTKAWRE